MVCVGLGMCGGVFRVGTTGEVVRSRGACLRWEGIKRDLFGQVKSNYSWIKLFLYVAEAAAMKMNSIIGLRCVEWERWLLAGRYCFGMCFLN